MDDDTVPEVTVPSAEAHLERIYHGALLIDLCLNGASHDLHTELRTNLAAQALLKGTRIDAPHLTSLADDVFKNSTALRQSLGGKLTKDPGMVGGQSSPRQGTSFDFGSPLGAAKPLSADQEKMLERAESDASAAVYKVWRASISIKELLAELKLFKQTSRARGSRGESLTEVRNKWWEGERRAKAGGSDEYDALITFDEDDALVTFDEEGENERGVDRRKAGKEPWRRPHKQRHNLRQDSPDWQEHQDEQDRRIWQERQDWEERQVKQDRQVKQEPRVKQGPRVKQEPRVKREPRVKQEPQIKQEPTD